MADSEEEDALQSPAAGSSANRAESSCMRTMATTSAFCDELEEAFVDGRTVSVQLQGYPCRHCGNPGAAQCMCNTEISIDDRREILASLLAP